MLYNVSSINNSNNSNSSSSDSEEEEGESFLGLGWGQVEWAVLLLGIGTTVAAISWMVR